ncbi:RIIB protein [Vibrio phage 1.170.O._10N.261.52.C3]|nr:RIIB protein [Vibrio phage 1.170.O._10N.261.52.C3]
MSRSNIVKCKSDLEKMEIVKNWSWQNTLTKKSFANKYGISTRTLNRILNEFEGEDWYQEEDTLEPVPRELDYTVTKNQITILLDGEPESIRKGFPRFNEFRNKLISEGFSDKVLLEVYEVMNLPKYVEKFSEGNITVDHELGKVWYGTFEIKNSLVDHLIIKLNEGHDPKGFVKFTDMLMSNPKKDIVEELYGFMEYNGIGIDDEGYILAYRGLNEDFTDCFTGTIDNSVGSKPRMPASEVEHDPKKGCGKGLHAGSLEYAKQWSRGKVVKVRIHPSDVVSVPWDCDSQKMRTCGYEVIEEV